ncbi:hypothetical protein PoB_005003600 [Plakobranchus ocellatus]|uniref:Uncharacterized protein n=1 Tax=Plakobranchus ocellatus TaxID=259542 RepID=A0AAV4BJM9_9GAST|nr:hypothetical protein PoB_005003600 [Plakobranchus ocellatus]
MDAKSDKKKIKCSSSGCIKSEDRTMSMEKKKVLNRWSEYVDDLFKDGSEEKPKIGKSLQDSVAECDFWHTNLASRGMFGRGSDVGGGDDDDDDDDDDDVDDDDDDDHDDEDEDDDDDDDDDGYSSGGSDDKVDDDE